MNSPSQRILALAVASALALPFSGKAHDGDDHDRFDFEQASAQWWQWALSIPAGVNPLADDTGVNCMVGQRGPVWFLAGSFGGTATRHCSIPEEAVLFFPVVNSVQFDSPNLCGQDGNSLSLKQLRGNAAKFIGGVSGLTATLDSQPLRSVRRVRSGVFAVALPADNLFGGGTTCPSGIYSPTVGDGYYARIDRLTPGRHVLQFAARNDADNFSLNVTYVLHVVRTRQVR